MRSERGHAGGVPTASSDAARVPVEEHTVYVCVCNVGLGFVSGLGKARRFYF